MQNIGNTKEYSVCAEYVCCVYARSRSERREGVSSPPDFDRKFGEMNSSSFHSEHDPFLIIIFCLEFQTIFSQDMSVIVLSQTLLKPIRAQILYGDGAR